MSSPDCVLAADRLVATLREQAELLRGRATQLRAAGADVRWNSWAAIAFHKRLEQCLDTLLHSAAQFDAAAEQVVALAAVS